MGRFRCLIFADPGAELPTFLQSRSGKPFNRYFPEVLRAARDAVDRPLVLDGEIVVAFNDEHSDRLD